MITRRILVSINKNIILIHRLIAAITIAALLVTLSACSDDGNSDNTDTATADASMLDANNATIRYTFRDSSTPPNFHRSYTVISDVNTTNLTIDSYGDILDEASMATNFDALALVLARLEESELPAQIGFDEESAGCTGGPSIFLTLFSTSDLETPVRSISVYNCASEEAKLAFPELENIIDPVLAPFDVATLINNTRQ